jgi:hypothetical protein
MRHSSHATMAIQTRTIVLAEVEAIYLLCAIVAILTMAIKTRTIVLAEVEAALDRSIAHGLLPAAQVQRMAAFHTHTQLVEILQRRQGPAQVGLHPT